MRNHVSCPGSRIFCFLNGEMFTATFFVWAIRRPTAQCVAQFFYQHIYCRYLSPGEIIHDRGGEFCNKICKIMHEKFGVRVNVISAGKPQGNGQAESMVKKLKEKMRALMIESCDFCLYSTSDFLLMLNLILRRKPWSSKQLGRNPFVQCRAGGSCRSKLSHWICTCWNIIG